MHGLVNEFRYNYDFLRYGAILFIVGAALRLMSSGLGELGSIIIPNTGHGEVSFRVGREHAQKISKIIRGERIGL